MSIPTSPSTRWLYVWLISTTFLYQCRCSIGVNLYSTLGMMLESNFWSSLCWRSSSFSFFSYPFFLFLFLFSNDFRLICEYMIWEIKNQIWGSQRLIGTKVRRGESLLLFLFFFVFLCLSKERVGKFEISQVEIRRELNFMIGNVLQDLLLCLDIASIMSQSILIHFQIELPILFCRWTNDKS